MDVSLLNNLSDQEATEQLTRCCGSGGWVKRMMALRPFRSADHLFSTAEEVWLSMSEPDWREAFTHHPKIGDIDSLKAKFATTANWSANEQSGVDVASDDVLQQLKNLNEDYEHKFGFIFIVCATGKTAPEMLELLKERIGNKPVLELHNAVKEQSKITKLRLEKLCQEVLSPRMS